jgi:hypothetical protein
MKQRPKPTVSIDCLTGDINWECADENLINVFYSKQASILSRYGIPEISQNFYDRALTELKESFRYGECRGVMTLFKDKLNKNEFYNNQWLVENRYGVTFPAKPSVIGFGWNFKKLGQISEDNLVLIGDVIPYIAFPFNRDFEKDHLCKMVVGFEKKSDRLEKLISDTFYQKPKLGKREDSESYHQMPFDFSEETWNGVLEKSKPTVRLFHTESGKLRMTSIF